MSIEDMIKNIDVIGVKLKKSVKAEVVAFPELDLTSPEHLRTGITSSLCNLQAIVQLLINKKIITEKEFLGESAVQLLKEVSLKESRVKKRIQDGKG